jgi:hypothetical protein
MVGHYGSHTGTGRMLQRSHRVDPPGYADDGVVVIPEVSGGGGGRGVTSLDAELDAIALTLVAALLRSLPIALQHIPPAYPTHRSTLVSHGYEGYEGWAQRSNREIARETQAMA